MKDLIPNEQIENSTINMDINNLSLKKSSNILKTNSNNLSDVELSKKLENDKEKKNVNIKKEKKKSYKILMKSLMTDTTSDVDKQKLYEEKLKNSMGGGNFKKIDKI